MLPQFPCNCEIHQRLNYYRKIGLEIHVQITDNWCWLDPNPNNSKDPEFIEREKQFTNPITFPSDQRPRDKEDYIHKVAKYGVYQRYATLMAERATSNFGNIIESNN